MTTIDTDYLLVGAGAAGMAFADSLISESDADVVIVDRRHRRPAPGTESRKYRIAARSVEHVTGVTRRHYGRSVMRGAGSALFAGIMLMIAGTLNIVYGIAAVGNASFFVNDNRYVFSSLHTWGWITIILGVIQLTASLSLFSGQLYGRVVGIIAATIGAIGALLSIGGAYPFWSLGIFAICLIVIHGLAVLGEPERA